MYSSQTALGEHGPVGQYAKLCEIQCSLSGIYDMNWTSSTEMFKGHEKYVSSCDKRIYETLFCCNGCNLSDACCIVRPYLHLLKDSSHPEDNNCYVPWVGPFGGWDSLALSGLNTEIWFRCVGFQNCFGIYRGQLLKSLAVLWSDLELNLWPHITAKSLVY